MTAATPRFQGPGAVVTSGAQIAEGTPIDGVRNPRAIPANTLIGYRLNLITVSDLIPGAGDCGRIEDQLVKCYRAEGVGQDET